MVRVWLDLDGVIFDFEKHFLKYFNLPKHHPKEWSDPRFVNNIHRVENNDDFWLSLPTLCSREDFEYPITGYCTARSCREEIIRESLLKNGWDDLPIINVGINGSKGEALKGVCDVMVDDYIKNFTDINIHGILCYLMTRPHNLNEFVGKFRVLDMKHFSSVVNSIHTLKYQKTYQHEFIL